MIRVVMVFLMLAGASVAAPIKVRSGEHEDFSRLVMPIPRGADWAIEGQSQQRILTVSPHNDGFDLNGAFDFIPRTRLLSLTGGPNKLVLDLNCDCEIRTELLANGYLVIDISDPETSIKTQAAQSTILPVTLPRRDVVLGKVGSQPKDDRVDAFRQTVLEQVSRAASQDLVDITTAAVVPQTAMPQMLDPAIPASPLAATAPVSRPEQPRIAVTNALEDALRSLDKIDRKASRSCYEPAHFDVSNWAAEGDLSTNLSLHRADLMGEFDRVNLDEIWALMRVYLRFGLVDEAKMVLGGFELSGPAADSARAVAAVLDEEEFSSDHPFLEMLDCDPLVAIWVAASGQGPSMSGDHAQAITPVFSAMPIELREMLAPKLIRAFEENELAPAAQIVRASLERVDAQNEADALTRQFLTQPEQMTNKALFDMVEANSDHSPDALERYLKRLLTTDTVPDVDLQTLTRAYIAELAGTKIAENLRRLDTRLSSRLGDFAIAFPASRDDPELLAHHVDDVLRFGTEEDVALLATRAISGSVVEIMSGNHRSEISERLGQMGLPDLAMQIVETLPETDDLRAELALGLRKNADVVPQPDDTLIKFRDAAPATIEPTLASAEAIVTQSAELTRAVEAFLITPP